MSGPAPEPGRADRVALDEIAMVLREAGHDSNHRRVLLDVAALVKQTGREVGRVSHRTTRQEGELS